MVKIERVDVHGWEAAIRGMRNPKNSWDTSDSVLCRGAMFDDCTTETADGKCPRTSDDFRDDVFCIGSNDLKLMKTLSNAGTDHGKFMRMITVSLDITAPFYWWKEFDTYKVGTVADSCSTMHKIHAKEFTMDDFSVERMSGTALEVMKEVVYILNINRLAFNETKDKKYWDNMIQLLPTSYNQKRTVLLNYAVLKAMYHARKTHKLEEWHTFCDWVKSLPYSELITGESEEVGENK